MGSTGEGAHIAVTRKQREGMREPRLQRLVPCACDASPPEVSSASQNSVTSWEQHSKYEPTGVLVLGETHCFLSALDTQTRDCAIRRVQMCRGTRKASAQIPPLAPVLPCSWRPRQGESYFHSGKRNGTLKVASSSESPSLLARTLLREGAPLAHAHTCS